MVAWASISSIVLGWCRKQIKSYPAALKPEHWQTKGTDKIKRKGKDC